VWLGIEGHVLQRVYYYIERDAVHEMGATPAVRAMLWSTPREVPAHAPADRATAGAAGAPAPGERAHLSRSAMLTSLKTPAGDFDIYLRELTALGWSAPQPIDGAAGDAREPDGVCSPHDEITPALSAAGDVLFFASNRPGGTGGFDIYSSRRAGDRWEKPVHLGARLNSPYDESGPAPHPYYPLLAYATTRPRSFILAPPPEWTDIILVNWRAADPEIAWSVLVDEGGRQRWSAPNPLHGIASRASDRDPVFSPEGDYLYFASERPGGLGAHDLFRARIRAFGDPRDGSAEILAEAPVNLGKPVNSVHDDLAPRLFLEGFALAYRVSMKDHPGELLLETRNREVESELEIASIPLRVLVENAARLGLLAGGGLALGVVGIVLFRLRRAWKPSLLARCAVASALFHVLLLYGFAFWTVSEDIVAVAEKKAEAEVTVEKLLQAKLTVETLRMDVRVPDGVLPDAPRATSAAPSAELRRFDIVKTLGGSDEVPAVEIAPEAFEPASVDLAAASMPRLEGPEASPSGEAPVSSVAAGAPRPPVPADLPLPDRRPAAPEEAGLRPAAASAPSSASPAGTPAPEAPTFAGLAATAVGAPGDTAVELAATQVEAPNLETATLPPVARPLVPRETIQGALPVPSQSPSASVEESARAPREGPLLASGRIAGPLDPAGDEAPQVKTTEAPGSLAHWRSQPLGLTPSVVAARDAEELPSSEFLPEGKPPPVPGSPVRLPEDLPRAEVASAVEKDGGPGPRAPERLFAARSPEVGDPSSERISVVPANETRPAVALADSMAPVTSAASVALSSEPRPGLAAADIPAPEPSARKSAVTLPERKAAETREAAGAREVSDILSPPGPRVRTERSGIAGAPGEPAPGAVKLGPVRTFPEKSAGEAAAGESLARAGAKATRIAPPPDGATLSGPEPLPSAPRAVPEMVERLAEAPPGLKGETDLRKIRTPGVRKALVEKMGGSGGSEDAVRLALEWLARHQSRDGHWDVDEFDALCRGCRSPGFQIHCDAAVTALAILCFLGQNHSPVNEGPFRRGVTDALDWLVQGQDAMGSLARQDQRYTMYSHGIATLALSEAYTLTRNEKYLEPLRRAVRLIIASQNPTTGGWRYQPAPPLRGDTSITGWQVLALTSARGAGLTVPESSFDRARHWLDVEVAGGTHGGIYGYTRPDEPRLAMVAEGMFARQLLGAKRTDRKIEESARYIHSETRTGSYLDNLYLLYYGNLALYHYQGWIWERWNRDVRDFLVRTQHKTGPLAGSWDPNSEWSEPGGRVLSTCFAALTLEVYYRYLPLYWKADQAQGEGRE